MNKMVGTLGKYN